MIKSIHSSGQYVQVTGGNPPSTYFNSGTPGSGMVRYNSNTNQLEVNDGSSWRTLDMGYASIGLSSVAESALNWALQKMGEEEEFKRLSESHPAVKLAWENLNKAKDQLKATVILSKEYDKTTS